MVEPRFHALCHIWEKNVNVETSIRCDHNQNPAVCKVTTINYNEKTAKKKRQASRFSRYFGQSSRPSSGDLMKIRILVTICNKTVTIDI